MFFTGIYKTASGVFLNPLVPIGVIFFEVWAAAKTMNNSIVFMATKGCGTKVDVQFKNGKTTTLEISEIYKIENEKVLIETFAEPFLFPITASNKKRFFYGHGNSAKKDGEIF